ncbi:metal-dependent hydrolase [Ramlibacter albus]|uniref:Metal-dependent hydrolase n=1 Tax=Ramlibacter albus TaxID=2079448 RepID=A0A923S551_9BURK|nr:metal-dependent hydrolase [Ramlibacter albus]MBC5768156.1 metal-dependent hydrolase [Ramlibacter albus]
MSPITHFLVGWVALERLQASPRDKALVALAGVAPDLDGVGIVVDFATRTFGLPETNYYQEFHRMYGHGLPAAVVIAAMCAALATRRAMVLGCAFVAVHLHFLCDLIGSRGSTPQDIWGIYYLAPLSPKPEFAWAGQWPLVGWQNMVITALLLAWTFARATRTGYTPLALVSARADAELVATLRRWRGGIGWL